MWHCRAPTGTRGEQDHVKDYTGLTATTYCDFISQVTLHTCVCPLWNRAEPWRGLKRSTSQEIFLKAVSSLPSHLSHKQINLFKGASCLVIVHFTAEAAHLLYSFSTKLRKISLLTVLKDSITSNGSAWGNFSTHGNIELTNTNIWLCKVGCTNVWCSWVYYLLGPLRFLVEFC